MLSRQTPSPSIAARTAPAHRAIAVANGIDGFVTRICRLVVLATGLALPLMLTANVAARYAFSAGGLDAAQELPERLFPWFIVAGVLAAQAGGHMSVEWLFNKLGLRGGRWLILSPLAASRAAPSSTPRRSAGS